MGLVRARSHRSPRQAHRLRGRRLTRRGRPARLRGGRHAARRRHNCRDRCPMGDASSDRARYDGRGMFAAGPATSRSSHVGSRTTSRVRRWASMSRSRATCRARPASAARAHSSSRWPLCSHVAADSIRGPSGARRYARRSIWRPTLAPSKPAVASGGCVRQAGSAPEAGRKITPPFWLRRRSDFAPSPACPCRPLAKRRCRHPGRSSS